MRKDGLTKQEGKVMDSLVNAWNAFIKLPKEHPSDTQDFCNGIHQCQHILMSRILRRDYPESYPSTGPIGPYKEQNNANI